MTKTTLQKQHDEFMAYVDDMMRRGRVPKYGRKSVESSIAKQYRRYKIKDFYVTLHFIEATEDLKKMPKELIVDREGKKMTVAPKTEVLEELEMSVADYVEYVISKGWDQI